MKLVKVAFVAIFLFISTEVFAGMFGLFNKSDFLLSAPVQGILLDNGKPVAKQKVIRSLTYDKEYIDETITDENGRFRFDEKLIRTAKPANMFDNDSLIQHIYLENGTPEGIVLWYTSISIHENSNTLRGLLSDLVCELSKSPQTVDIQIAEAPEHTFAIYGMCELNKAKL
ncbi:DUF6795 domain-containing protein [Pseudoalteromonas sp. Ps84H-4]|uniref:DUF6795 domain-containing protein n=1 Tax=Pseudoalteromonas sp. Ps84H-4 TaxID=2954502 RepID=UPI002097D948|nr:DUF6795 domain-containing protein [Pseudoalteromonas sp. Ps84H-4]MCO7252213.1 hypothetical protein [Pseudoalteromonas sp. Ps84H-4]